MEATNRQSLIIVNRCYPPFSGITGASAWELAGFLKTRMEVDIHAICISDNYGNIAAHQDPDHNVIALNSVYGGKQKIMRLLGSVFESLAMVRRAKKLAKTLGNATIIVMTDPPLLNFFAATTFKNKYQWGLWSMDLYPESFYAAGLISKSNFIFRRIRKALIKYPPYFLITLGKAQLKYLINNYGWNCPSFIIPCGVRLLKNYNSPKPEWAITEKIIFGYCGNLGEAHNENLILDFLQLMDPSKHLFVYSIYGSKGKHIVKAIQNYPGTISLKNVPPDELAFIDVHLVSLLDKWVHVCVPSKVFSGVCVGASFLYNGSSEGDNWQYLQEAGWRIDEKYKQEELKQIMNEITLKTILEKRETALRISNKLNEGKTIEFNRLTAFLAEGKYIPVGDEGIRNPMTFA